MNKVSYVYKLEEAADVLRMAMVLNDMSVIKPEHLSVVLSLIDKELFLVQEVLDEQSEDNGDS